MAAIEMPILHPGVLLILPDETYGDTKGTIVDMSIYGQSPFMVGDVIAYSVETEIEVEVGEVTHRLVRARDVLGWYTRISRDAPPSI